MAKVSKRIVIIGLALVACDFLLFYYYGRLVEARFEEVSTAKADCAIVLFADFGDTFGLGDESVRRCRHGLQLFLEHRISAVVCSGGERPRKGKSGAKLMLRWFVEHGVPESVLHRETLSCDTLSSIRNSLELVKSLGYGSALVVSSPLHLYRVSALLSGKTRFAGIEFRLEPYSYKHTSPKPGPHLLLLHTHYEWISFGLFRWFPKGLYDEFIYLLRGCRPTRGLT